MSITVSKLCRAGRDHAALKSGIDWSSLEYVGTQRVPASDDGPAYTLEMRNCECHSTLCREMPEPEHICNVCGDDGSADHTECVKREEYANTETEEERLGLRSMWSVLAVLLALALSACGDNRRAPHPDAIPVLQPACLTAPLEPMSCTTTLHHELCVNTIVLGSYRGCCQVGPNGLDFFPCE